MYVGNKFSNFRVREVNTSRTSFYLKILGGYIFNRNPNYEFKLKYIFEQASLRYPTKNIIISCITEPIAFLTYKNVDNSKMLSWFSFLHDVCDKLKFPPTQVVLLTSNVYGKECYAEWCRSNKIIPAINVKSQHKSFWSNQLISEGYNLDNVELEDKHFTMFVGRPRLHKDIIVKWYLKHIFNSDKEKNILSTFIYGNKSNFDGWDDQLIEKVKLLPGTIENNSSIHPTRSLPWGGDSHVFTKAFSRGLINFVIDYLECEDFDSYKTYLNFKNQNPWWHEDMISEKTFMCIVLKKPFIRLGMTHSLKRLKDWGFKTFDGILFDESYDDIEHLNEKLECILPQIDNYLNMSFDELKKRVYSKEVQEIVDHNYNLAYTLFNKEDFVDV